MVAYHGEQVMTARRGPRRSAERLRRLLVMLPWLMERGEVPVAEMAARFELTEAELVGDLELAALCGLPPFIDEMIDVFIDEGVVFAGLPRLFTKPLRLTAPEGFALLTSARAAMQLPGADPDGSLARALAKLAGVLGDDGVVVDVPQPPATADLAAAVNDNARLRVRYWSANRDEASDREITPRSIFLDRGHWYVIADDGRSGESRARSGSTGSSIGSARERSTSRPKARPRSCRRAATAGSSTATCRRSCCASRPPPVGRPSGTRFARSTRNATGSSWCAWRWPTSVGCERC